MKSPHDFQGGSKQELQLELAGLPEPTWLLLKKESKNFPCSFLSIQECLETGSTPWITQERFCLCHSVSTFFQSLHRFVKWIGVIKGQLKTQTAPELSVKFSLTHFRHQEGLLIVLPKGAHLFALCIEWFGQVHTTRCYRTSDGMKKKSLKKGTSRKRTVLRNGTWTHRTDFWASMYNSRYDETLTMALLALWGFSSYQESDKSPLWL